MTNKVRQIRQQQNLTQIDLAEKVGVSRQSIIAIESGKYVPTTLLALKIAKALGKKVEDVFILEKND